MIVLARVRALEVGKPVVRVGNLGPSLVALPNGNLLNLGSGDEPLAQYDVLISGRAGATPYMCIAPVFRSLAILALLAFAAVAFLPSSLAKGKTFK